MRVVIDSMRILASAPAAPRTWASVICESWASAREDPNARTRVAPRNGRRTGLLAPAAAARRRSIAPCGAFSRVVKLLSAVGVERLVGQPHHRVGESSTTVLRYGGASRRQPRDQDCDERSHRVPPI